MPPEKDLDFMDFVADAAKTTGNEESWAYDFLSMLCEPGKTAGDVCQWLNERGYKGVRIKDVQTLMEVSKKVGGERPRWRKQVKDLEGTDY